MKLDPDEQTQTAPQLLPGKQIGAYKILALLGRGGMGVVYRARDERLRRDVAIKVLPYSFANDADRLRRFEQEARATSALNHPNILTVHDIGTQDGAPFIVAELLEGEELRAQLKSGAMSVHKALEYAQQISRTLGVSNIPFDVTADGQRFLINAVVETEPKAPLTVVVNWAAGVKR